MAAYLEAVPVITEVIGIMDHPTGEPQDLLFQLPQRFQIRGGYSSW